MGWKYKQSIELSSATTLTNYQIQFTIWYQSGSSGWGALYTNNHCNTDFSDIRFKNASGVSLPYYIEEKYDGNSAQVWVKVDSIDAATTIYFYYGNTEATSESSSANTFIFFDGFENGVTGWTTCVSSPTMTQVSDPVYSGNYVGRYTTTGSNADTAMYKDIGNTLTSGTIECRVRRNTTSGYVAIPSFGAYGVSAFQYVAMKDATFQYYVTSFNNVGESFNVNVWYWVRIDWKTSTTYDIYINNVLCISNATIFSGTLSSTNIIGVSGYTASTNLYIDNIIVRAYAATEPSYGTCSAEQLVSSSYSFGVIIW
jgi:hypothetical protein